MKIAIDIGHARGTGARGNGLEEHALCAAMAPALKQALEAHGIESDIIDYPDLSNKADLSQTVRTINAGGYAASISLHCDASDNPSAHGAHVCYVSAAGETIARAIAAHLCPLMPGRAQQVVRRGDLYVLTHTVCPAVLVECGFITHPFDCHIMTQRTEAVADAIAQGVADYMRG